MFVPLRHPDTDKTRLYPLQNGDVFSVNELLLEFEDGICYEVIRVRDTIYNPQFKRTGKSFTPEQINEITIKCNKCGNEVKLENGDSRLGDKIQLIPDVVSNSWTGLCEVDAIDIYCENPKCNNEVEIKR
jgi:hypothetical protein